MVMKNTSRRYYGWHRPLVEGVRMAEWLRPGLWEVLTIKLRGIEPGQILAHKTSIGWADGDEKHVPSLLWMAYTTFLGSGWPSG